MNLDKIAPLVKKEIQNALAEKRYPFGVKGTKKGNKIATGNLYNSVKVTPVERNYGMALLIEMADYWKQVQDGTPRGTDVEISKLMTWIRARGFNREKKTGKYKSFGITQFAKLIQRNIYLFGVRPSNFLDVAIENILDNNEILTLLEEATYKDLIEKIEGI